VARKVVLAWATSNASASDTVLMESFGLRSLGALRKASSRASAMVEADPRLGDAMSKVMGLFASGWDNTGLTRVVRYRAARAAS
jgi:hypothetical protein